jgi:Tol biopolymer transport system component
MRDTVPQALDDAVLRALAKIPADRYRGAREFVAALDAAVASPVAAPPPRRTWLWLAGAAGAVAISVTALMVTRPDGNGGMPAVIEYPPARQASFTGDVGMFVLAPDDRTVAYLSGDNERVILFDLDGGGSQTLFTTPSGTVLDDLFWSADGSRLYLTTFPYSSRVWSIPRLGGEPREEQRLDQLAGLNGLDVVRLADGRWLVAGSGNTLYLGSDPGTTRVVGTLLSGDGTFRIPGLASLQNESLSVSPDGAWIAFGGLDSAANPVSGIAAVPSSGMATIVARWEEDLQPLGWSRDGRTLGLARSAAGRTVDVVQVGFDPATGQSTSGPSLLYPRLDATADEVSSSRGRQGFAALSTDGRRLVFRTGPMIRNLREITLDATPAPGDNPQRMITTGTGRWMVGLFLPDGDVLGFSLGGSRYEVMRFEAGGASRSVAQRDGRPLRSAYAVSGDGRKLAFAEERGSGSQLLVLELGSGRIEEVAMPEAPSSLAWSPDGQFIAAMTTSSPDRMMVADLSAATVRTVMLDCGARCQFAYEGVVAGADWPRVAVTSEVDTWIVDVETGGMRHLAERTWLVIEWVGDWVYFARGGGQTDSPGFVLFRVPAAGGAEERLLDIPLDCDFGWGIKLSRDGRKLACSVDGSQVDLHVIDGLGVGR